MPPAADDLAIAEDALAAGNLGVEQLGAGGIALAFSAKGAADSCQQNMGRNYNFLSIVMIRNGGMSLKPDGEPYQKDAVLTITAALDI